MGREGGDVLLFRVVVRAGRQGGGASNGYPRNFPFSRSIIEDAGPFNIHFSLDSYRRPRAAHFRRLTEGRADTGP